MSDTRIYELFRQALEAEDREAFLISCGEDRAEVEALLAAYDESDDEFLETPARERLWSLAPGDRVGRYTIKRKIGAGGGGTVYEAEQEQPRRTVALKVLPPGTERFAEEAEVLARLKHPAIATVHEAGRHENALYLAMELVEGPTLREWAHERTRRERLAVFVRVCEAVHHGHVKGVVHRDLKPANILVSEMGPKVIDFGIAAPVGDAAAPAGTLTYMSPEQRAGEELDARTDVYSLGVVLGELAPHAPPDLAAVVAKATSDDRYASAAALGDDVTRFLRHEPVAARTYSWPRLVALFARRRTGVAAALAALVLVLAAGVAVSMHFAINAATQRDEAIDARKETERRGYVGHIALAQNALVEHDVVEARRRLEEAPEHLRGWEWRHLMSVLDMADRRVDLGTRPFAGTVRAPWLGAVSGDRLVLVDARNDDVRSWRLGDLTALCVDLAPHLSLAACGTKSGSVVLFDTAAGRVVHRWDDHTGPVNDVRFLDSRLASASSDGTLRVWEVATRKPIHVLRGHADRVITVRFDGKGRILSGCRDGTIRIWQDGKTVREWSAHGGSVEGLALSPDGDRLASASRDRTVRIWDLATGKRLATGWGHADNVRAVAWHGDVIATASYDRTVRLWSAADATPIAKLLGHENNVRSIAFLDSSHVVSFGDRTARVWRVAARDAALRLGDAGGVVGHAEFEGARVRGASAAGSVVWWNQAGGIDERIGFDRGVGWSQADGDTVRAWLADGQVVFRSRRDEASTRRFRAPGPPAWRAPSDDLYSARGADVLRHRPHRTIYYRERHPATIRALALEPDGGDVATGCEAGYIRIHTHASLLRETRPIARAVSVLAYAPHAKQIAAAYDDGTVLVLRAHDLAVLHRLRKTSVDALAFHPTEPRLATGGEDETVRLWDTGTGQQVAVLHAGIRIRSVAFAPDGARLLAAGGGDTGSQVLVWSAPR